MDSIASLFRGKIRAICRLNPSCEVENGLRHIVISGMLLREIYCGKIPTSISMGLCSRRLSSPFLLSFIFDAHILKSIILCVHGLLHQYCISALLQGQLAMRHIDSVVAHLTPSTTSPFVTHFLLQYFIIFGHVTPTPYGHVNNFWISAHLYCGALHIIGLPITALGFLLPFFC